MKRKKKTINPIIIGFLLTMLVIMSFAITQQIGWDLFTGLTIPITVIGIGACITNMTEPNMERLKKSSTCYYASGILVINLCFFVLIWVLMEALSGQFNQDIFKAEIVLSLLSALSFGGIARKLNKDEEKEIRKYLCYLSPYVSFISYLWAIIILKPERIIETATNPVTKATVYTFNWIEELGLMVICFLLTKAIKNFQLPKKNHP